MSFKLFCLLTSLVAFSSCDGKNKITFLTEPLNVPVNEKDPVTFDCKANVSITICQWTCKPDGTRPLYTVRPGITPGYDLRGDLEKGECNLLIRETHFDEHRGVWKCFVGISQTDNATSHQAFLDVYIPPADITIMANMPEMYFQHKMMLYTGNKTDKLLTCQSLSSNPPAQLAWLLEHDVLQGRQNVLFNEKTRTYKTELAPNVTVGTEFHMKNLTCRGTHPMWGNEPRTKNVTLIVRHPISAVHLVPDTLTIHVGEESGIRCGADGFPNPKITWFKRDFTSSNWDILRWTKPDLKVGLKPEDAGVYRCSALNFLNNNIPVQSELCTVYVEYPTTDVVLYNPQKEDEIEEGSTLSFGCWADGYPEPQISWWRKKTHDSDSWVKILEGHNLTLFNVTHEDNGLYRCVGLNPFNNIEVLSNYTVHIDLIGPGRNSGFSKQESWYWILLITLLMTRGILKLEHS